MKTKTRIYKAPVIWHGKVYESIAECGRQIGISRSLANYYISINRHFRGSKIIRAKVGEGE